MPTQYARRVSHLDNRCRKGPSEAKYDDRRRADRVVTIAIPMPKSEVEDIDNAIAWAFVLGEET